MKIKPAKRKKKEDISSLHHKAAQYHQGGQTKQAISIYNRILKQEPKNADALNALGIIASQNEEYQKAEQYFKRALKILPNISSFYTNLGHALKNQEKYDSALDCYKSAIDNMPGNKHEAVKGYLNIAKTLTKCNRDAEAVDVYKQSLAIAPDNPETHTRLGNTYKALGEFQEAINHFQKALSIQDDYIDAIHDQTTCKKYSDADTEEIKATEAIMKRGDLPEENLAVLSFALGKMYNDLQSYDKAFEYYLKGNSIRHRLFPFDDNACKRKTEKIIGLFTPDFFAKKKDFGIPSDAPVFIVGMPRSGTTLVEQIISKHTRVLGAGELTKIGAMAQEAAGKGKEFPDTLQNLKKNAALKLASEYQQYLGQLLGEDTAQRITDKMPANFQYLGFIALLFPHAHIIHCRRNPMDTCLSNFFQCFTSGNSQSYDLQSLAEYYAEYERLMTHWRQVLPLPMHEVQYEKLIDEPEKETRKLIRFIDLEWEEGCLQYHTKSKVVNTASAWQARQPIYTSSKERWRKYQSFLEPLHKGLKDNGIDLGS